MSINLFISDLHLSEQHPEITERFIDFMTHTAVHADNLYILGDFFNFWIGDDFETELTRRIKSALNTLSKQQTNIYLMHGNRDFLLGNAFAKAANCQLLNDPAIISLNNTPTLLAHGDSFCTDDKSYQRFRDIVRRPIIQKTFLKLPLKLRLKLANQARNSSKKRTQLKIASQLDVNQQSIINVFKQHDCPVMIHGHTHKLKKHIHSIDNKEHQRFVLGDWTVKQGNFLLNTGDGNEFVQFEQAPTSL